MHTDSITLPLAHTLHGLTVWFCRYPASCRCGGACGWLLPCRAIIPALMPNIYRHGEVHWNVTVNKVGR